MVPRLFSAFVQANAGMSRRYGGTGLGLAISKQLVELMGGAIDVHSAPGVGSEFVFHVPVRVGETQIDMAMLEEPEMPSFNVLVVDDNETNRTVIENMLDAWGMKVTQAVHGRQALELLLRKGCHDGDFDLALVDMNMPELDGLGLAEALRQSGRHPNLKMILLSSVSSPDDVRRAQEVGYQRFVPKPLRKAELRQAILGITAELGTEGHQEALRLNKSVLVIEDNTVNQEVCSHMLKRLGCEVRVAASALEGLRRLGEQRFDLILMDIQMPGMDGVEALSWFRRGSSSRFHFITPSDTPVIAVTANALEGDEERFLNLGFDDYLSKPFRQSQLQKVLVEHTQGGDDAPASAGQATVTPPSALPQTPPAATLPPRAPAMVSPLVHKAPVSSAAPMSLSLDGPTVSEPRTVLDADALARLRELDPRGDNRLLERVAKAFETSVGRLLPQLDEAFKMNDQAAITHVAHTLKSSSASIGALKLSQMCAEIETMIRRQTGEDLSSRIRDIPNEAHRVLDSLSLLLETP
jgi:CheY-like chemotaxis protein